MKTFVLPLTVVGVIAIIVSLSETRDLPAKFLISDKEITSDVINGDDTYDNEYNETTTPTSRDGENPADETNSRQKREVQTKGDSLIRNRRVSALKMSLNHSFIFIQERFFIIMISRHIPEFAIKIVE